MEFTRLNEKAKNYWALTYYIFAFIFIVASINTLIFVPFKLKIILGITGVFPLCLLAIFFMIYPFLKYRYYGYFYDNERVVIKYGVIFKHVLVIPICQIQDLHIVQGPIMALFKLKGVIFSTAGSNFELSCLDSEVAKTIVSEVEVNLKKRLEDLANEKIQ